MYWHSIELRQRAAGLIEAGSGYKAVARRLALSPRMASKWVYEYRAVGRKAFLAMGSTHREYDYETKLAAVRDFLEHGMTKPEVMARYSIASLTALERWVRAYRAHGPQALRPGRRGRPRGSRTGHLTREQELEEENRLLRTRVAYLEKLRALGEERPHGGNAV